MHLNRGAYRHKQSQLTFRGTTRPQKRVREITATKSRTHGSALQERSRYGVCTNKIQPEKFRNTNQSEKLTTYSRTGSLLWLDQIPNSVMCGLVAPRQLHAPQRLVSTLVRVQISWQSQKKIKFPTHAPPPTLSTHSWQPIRGRQLCTTWRGNAGGSQVPFRPGRHLSRP